MGTFVLWWAPAEYQTHNPHPVIPPLRQEEALRVYLGPFGLLPPVAETCQYLLGKVGGRLTLGVQK